MSDDAGRPGRGRGAGYAFGDTDRAAARLALIGEVFEPTTRAFLADADRRFAHAAGRPDPPVELAVDLGCGPGHTTRLLAETLRPRRTVGLDSSPAFIDLARRVLAGPEAERPAFLVHDITRTPFPTGAADVLFCRFLLTHLPSPGGAIAAWATQLRRGGLLLVDEVDRIAPGHPALRDYLAAVDALLSHQGHRLYVGPLLHALPAPAGLEVLASQVATISPPAEKAAAMFGMNLRVWRGHPYARSELGDTALDRLAAELEALTVDPGDATITWGLRQIVYRRPA